MNIQKKKILMKAFFMVQFSYCLLILMFHNRKLNNGINKLHERCLRRVYIDSTLTLEELLEPGNSVSVHHRNFQVLASELHKIVNVLPPEITKEVFPFNENTSYNTRNKINFHSRAIKLVTFGSKTLSILATKIFEIENVKLVACLKRAIKKWKPINSHCRLCQTYVFQVGFV